MTGMSPAIPSLPLIGDSHGKPLLDLPSCQKAVATLEASRLIQLGARAGLVNQLTGVDKSTANRLYRQIHGRPSPPGQTLFTDAWYLRSDRRMLHAAVIWRLHQNLGETGKRPGRALIDLFETYHLVIPEDHFDIMRVAFVPRLVEMCIWHERACSVCGSPYVAPVENPGTTCPGCRLHRRYRCQGCWAPAEGYRKGRRRSICPGCGNSAQR